MIRVGVIGAKGYSAGEAIRLLAGHPEVEIACLMARVEKPEPLGKYFPEMRGVIARPIEPMDLGEIARRCDAAVLALPHTVGQEIAARLIADGVKVIDISADFRFDSVAAYEKTYGVEHKAPELNARLPYAQPELFRDEIAGAPGLACPGCYPTATLLGLAPIMTLGDDFDLDRIVVNAMSGVSGAGRKLDEMYLFVEANENAQAYSVGKHRHRPEIEEKLARLAGRPVRIVFTTHLIPVTRGILATTVVPIKRAAGLDEIAARYRDFYAGRPFVRVLDAGAQPTLAGVQRSNFCDIGLAIDAHAGALIVTSAIDNLTKGASGQAIQAMNILFGLPETMGLLPGSARRTAV